MISGFVSLNSIISTVYRNLGINYEINQADCAEWAAESLAMIGAYSQYQETSACLTLVNGKVKLPLGFDKLVDIRYKNSAMYWATNTNASNYQCSECQIPVCSSGKLFQSSDGLNINLANSACNNTFYVNDSYLITNITDEDASVCIVYLGVKVDEEGYPMIPDDIYYSKAVSSYIIERLDYQEWRKGKITDKVYDHSEKNWMFYVNSARGAANMPNSAQLENLKNIVTRLMPLRNEYAKGFVNISKPERINSK